MSRPFVQLLSTNGDGTGTTNAIGDYSSAAETFELADQTDALETVVVRLIVYVEDSGAFDAAGYGNAGVLANGITVSVLSAAGAEIIDLTPDPIKSNGGWASLAYDTQVATWGTGNEFLVTRWTFGKFTPDGGIVLTDGERLVVNVNDDLTDLVAHRFTAQGYTSHSY